MATTSQSLVLSRLVCIDNISINTISKSKDIRTGIELQTRKTLPSSNSTLRSMVIEFHRAIVDEISYRLSEEGSFSVTCDEWTSLANQRYLNVNCHLSTKTFCLGLTRINNKANSQNLLDLIKQKIGNFSAKLDNITAITCDGAAVMKKLGRIAGTQLQLCFNHAIHLAVYDAIFLAIDPMNQSDNSSDEEETLTNSVEVINEAPSTTYIDEILEKVRKIVRSFRKSPVKNDALMKILKENSHAGK